MRKTKKKNKKNALILWNDTETETDRPNFIYREREQTER